MTMFVDRLFRKLNSSFKILSILFTVLVLGLGQSHAQEVAEYMKKLLATDGQLDGGNITSNDEFGRDVAISGNTAIVGVPGDYNLPPSLAGADGSVYVYEFDGEDWKAKQKLVPQTPFINAAFGSTVAIDGDVIAVGAKRWTGSYQAGVVYLFHKIDNQWVETQIIEPDTVVDHNFQYGTSFALQGDKLLIGSPFYIFNRNTIPQITYGVVFYYKYDGISWILQQSLADPSLSNHSFGQAVALDDDGLVITSWPARVAHYYALENGLWAYKQTISSTGSTSFGVSAALDGDRMLVGAPYDAISGAANAGAVYFYEYDQSQWKNETRVTESSPRTNNQLGESVALEGDIALAGTRGNAATGYVYLHNGTEWEEKVQFNPQDVLSFAWSIDVSEGAVLFGAPYDDDLGSSSGSAYVYEIIARPGLVKAADGAGKSVKVTWKNRSKKRDGFKIFRDGEEIGSMQSTATSYTDDDALPGKIHEYSVMAVDEEWDNSAAVGELGWAKANGRFDGAVKTIVGAGVKDVALSLRPEGTGLKNALFFAEETDHAIKYPVTSFPDTAITVSFWMNSGYLAYQGTPFSYATTVSDNTFLIFDITDFEVIINGVSSGKTGVSSTDEAWHHIAVTWRSTDGSVHMYKDGEVVYSGTLAQGFSIPGDGALVFGQEQDAVGGGFQNTQVFLGALDEVRIWKTARGQDEIRADMHRKLNGNETGLSSYWNFDETDRTRSGIAGDFARNGGNHMQLMGADYSEFAMDLDYKTHTDPNGDYTIDNIFYSEERNFQIVPRLPRHGFDPGSRNKKLDLVSPAFSSIDFTDTTSFSVTGRIVQTLGLDTVNISGAEIFLNDHFTGVKSDAQGFFAITVEQPGRYTIEPRYENHLIAAVDTLIEDDVLDLLYEDMNKDTLLLTVKGGCNLFIGQASLTISNTNNPKRGIDTTITTNNVSGAFELVLPSREYMIEFNELIINGNTSQYVDPGAVLFDPVVVDLTNGKGSHDFVYRKPPEMRITGFEQFGCAPYDVPILEQGTGYTLRIEVIESFGPDTCLVDSGFVAISDNISSDSEIIDTLALDHGVAYYTVIGGEPNILFDANHPYQKRLGLTAIVGTQTRTEDIWALIVGNKPNEATFATVSPEIPLTILRDPPGDGSYSYLSEENSICTTIGMGFQTDASLNLWGEAKVGFKFSKGLGFSTETKGWGSVRQELGIGATIISQTEQQLCITTNKTFTTSGNDNIIGSGGDIYVGAALNLIYALTTNVRYDETQCRVTLDTSIVIANDGFATTFMYTENHVKNVLMNQLDELRAVYASAGSDSARIYANQMEVWQNVLNLNQRLKEKSIFMENRSFSAGAQYEASRTISTDKTETLEFNMFIEGAIAIEAGVEESGSGFSLGAEVRARMQYGKSQSNTTSTASTVGFVFDDDDPGDFFSVDIKGDPVYGTPVFNLVSGRSSCPFEEGTQPRDDPSLTLNTSFIDNIDPEEAAPFILTVGNASQSGETRSYRLGVIQSSNLDGAEISVGGVVIEDFIEYTIPAGQGIQATMAVKRGPLAYNYEDIYLRLYSGCDPYQADTVRFSTRFQSPCSGISIYKPFDNFIFNQSSNDSVIVVLREFDLDDENLQTIALQYRTPGVNWKSAAVFRKVELTDNFKTFVWDISQLADGEYELRAVANCGAIGVSYSPITRGVIDRSSLLVFGSPQPSDGMLNLGEDIRIAFTSNLNCGEITARNVSLIDESDGSNVVIDFACNDNSLVIVPRNGLAALENRTLTATVRNLTDVNGNILKKPVNWTFTVNQNAIYWVNSNVNMSVYQGETGQFTSTLTNVGGGSGDFSLTGLPSWITPDITTGSLPAGGSQNISFGIADNLNPGTYRDTVYAQVNGQGDDPLYIHVNILSSPPTWAVASSEYQYSMDVLVQVREGNNFAADDKDVVAAVVGNKVRGLANLQFVSDDAGYLGFMTVYSNQSSGENVSFRIWNASEGLESGFVEETLVFENNASVGILENPFTLTPSGRAQNITLNPAWTWFSLNLEYQDMSVNSVLSSLDATPGDVIKGQTGIATYSGNAWIGNLARLETGQSYRIYLAEEQDLRFAGQVIDLTATDIPVVAGWNWIGYLPQDIRDIESGLSGYTPSSGDRLKSQNAFSVFDGAGGLWQGGIDVLRPGAGYMLKSSRNGILSYPAAGNEGTILFNEKMNELNTGGNASLTSHDLLPQNFEFNMSIIGEVNMGGTALQDSGYTVYAYSGDQIRGSGHLEYYPQANKFLVFMSVYANSESGDSLRFVISNPSENIELPVVSKLVFTSDGIAGNADNPYKFAGLDEVAPGIRSAFLYSTEPGLADHVRLYITASEPLREAPLVRLVSPKGSQKALETVVFDAGQHIYQSRFRVTDFGENTFYISATDLAENLTLEVKKLTVQQIRSGEHSQIALNKHATVYIRPESFAASGMFFSEYREPGAETKKQDLEQISGIFEISATSAVRSGFDLRYDLKAVDKTEEDKRKIGLYRLDTDRDVWQFIGGQGTIQHFEMTVNQTGTYALFLDPERIPVPSVFELHQNYPNPFNPVTTIRFDLPEAMDVSLIIYDVLGQKVKELVTGRYEAGYHRVQWFGDNMSGNRVASGVYIYQIRAGKEMVTRKLVMLK